MSNYKRLERDLRNKVIGGVCSGLGDYFDMDPAFWRVLFCLLFFLGCSGLLIYIILWIVMPAKDYTNVHVDANDPDAQPSETQKKKRGSMIAGMTLIGIGALGLITRYVPRISWRTAWPIILIVIGIVLIIPFKDRKS